MRQYMGVGRIGDVGTLGRALPHVNLVVTAPYDARSGVKVESISHRTEFPCKAIEPKQTGGPQSPR